jgi:hypothetical protein
MATYLPVVRVCTALSREALCVCTALSREGLCVCVCVCVCTELSRQGLCVCVLHSLERHCIKLPDDGSLVIRNM